MARAHVKGFAKAVIYDEAQFAPAVSTLLQSAGVIQADRATDIQINSRQLERHAEIDEQILIILGIGALKPNTVLIGWPTERRKNDLNEEQNSDYWDFIDKVHGMLICFL